MPVQDNSQELGAFSRVDRTDAADFIDRLDRIHRVNDVRAYKARVIAELRLSDGASVCDVGCGPGDDIAALADLVGTGGEAVGVDLSAAMIGEAKQRFADKPNLTFVNGSGDVLPFGDASFDAVRADRMLIHVPDANAVVGQMLRVLKPGGRIVVSEPDILGSWISSDDSEIGEAVCRAVALSCANPYLPRNLGVWFQDMRFDDTSHFSIATITNDFSTVDGIFKFELVTRMLAGAGKFEAGRLDDWYQDQLRRQREGRFCACMNIVVAAATKPASTDRPFMLGDD